MKKFLYILASVAAIFVLAGGLVACDEEKGKQSTPAGEGVAEDIEWEEWTPNY